MIRQENDVNSEMVCECLTFLVLLKTTQTLISIKIPSKLVLKDNIFSISPLQTTHTPSSESPRKAPNIIKAAANTLIFAILNFSLTSPKTPLHSRYHTKSARYSYFSHPSKSMVLSLLSLSSSCSFVVYINTYSTT